MEWWRNGTVFHVHELFSPVLVCQAGQTSFDRCGRRCDCIGGRLVNCVRIRKEFTSLSLTERRRYIQTILTASTDTRFKNDYDRLLNDHRIRFATGIHQRIHFLSWHRYFILLYENLLRRVDCRFTVSYWDWSRVSGDPFRTTNPRDLWHRGNASLAEMACYPTGVYRRVLSERAFGASLPFQQEVHPCLDPDA